MVYRFLLSLCGDAGLAEENRDSFLQIREVSGGEAVCTFENLSASNRYRITCPGLEGASVVISEGRVVNFRNSLGRVLEELFFRIK